MKALTYTHDKSKFKNQDGPWMTEPDKKQWQDPDTGLPCLIVRGPLGALCGYVGVSEGHQLYKMNYMDDKFIDLDIHGGVTFTDSCQHSDEGHGICHIVEEGEDDAVWWIGFDCNHCNDYSPKSHWREAEHEFYRPFSYVEAQVISLAAQLVKIAKGENNDNL